MSRSSLSSESSSTSNPPSPSRNEESRTAREAADKASSVEFSYLQLSSSVPPSRRGSSPRPPGRQGTATPPRFPPPPVHSPALPPREVFSFPLRDPAFPASKYAHASHSGESLATFKEDGQKTFQLTVQTEASPFQWIPQPPSVLPLSPLISAMAANDRNDAFRVRE